MTIGEWVQAATFSGAAGLAVSTIVGSLSGTNGRKVLRALRGGGAIYEAPIGDTDMGGRSSLGVLRVPRWSQGQ